MRKYPAKTVQILSRSGLIICLMSGAVMGVHFIVMILESWVIKAPLFLNFEKDFVGTAFSAAMIPVLCAYAIFAVVSYVLWVKMKKAILDAQALELRSEKEKVVLESTITMHNSEILKWVEYRRSVGKHIPDEVEHASRSIASVVETMTEAAFIAPYTKGRQSVAKTIDEIDALLKSRVDRNETAGELV